MNVFQKRNEVSELVQDLLSKCRICLIENEKRFPMYGGENSTNYFDLIKEATGFELERRDNLPSNICEECLSELMTVIKFVTNVRVSNEKLSNDLNWEIQSKFFENGTNFTKGTADLIVDCDIKEEKSDLGHISDNYLVNEAFDNDDDEFNGSILLKIKKKLKKKSRSIAKTKSQKLPIIDDSFISNIEESDISRTHDRKDVQYFSKNKSLQFITYAKYNYEIVKASKDGLKKDMIKCLICGVLSQNRSAYLVHNRKHTGEKPYKCPVCVKCFTQVGSLNTHIHQTHLKKKELCDDSKGKGVNSFSCDTCGKVYNLRSSLITHLRVHQKEKQLQCSFCPQRFVQSGERLVHIRIHHTGEKPFCCHKCGKSFAASTNLTTHMLSHSEERKFKCDICSKAMKSNDNLKRHILVMHTPNKHNVCDICGAAFALKYKLNHHIKVWHINKHSGFCDICKKAFHDINKHMKRHTGDKPFACVMCHKTFFQEKHLIEHSQKHKFESATFKCTYVDCHSVFSKKCVLNFHIMKYHTKETPYTCQWCSRGFYRKGDLGRHVVSSHKNKHNFSPK